MVELFEILQREAQSNPSSVEIFFSSHPAPQDRIQELRADVERADGGTRDTGQFRTIKARLLKMPAAHTMPPQ
jgi:predicted Zn-dependent protease